MKFNLKYVNANRRSYQALKAFAQDNFHNDLAEFFISLVDQEIGRRIVWTDKLFGTVRVSDSAIAKVVNELADKYCPTADRFSPTYSLDKSVEKLANL